MKEVPGSGGKRGKAMQEDRVGEFGKESPGQKGGLLVTKFKKKRRMRPFTNVDAGNRVQKRARSGAGVSDVAKMGVWTSQKLDHR